MKTRTALLVFVPLLGLAGAARGQDVRRLVGDSVSASTRFNPATRETTHALTLAFAGAERSPRITLEFIVRLVDRVPQPPVVDVIVTQHPAEDERPSMDLRIDGGSLPINARLAHPRSIATTIEFSEFLRLINAGSVVERAFDADLEISANQLQMMRTVVARWTAAQ